MWVTPKNGTACLTLALDWDPVVMDVTCLAKLNRRVSVCEATTARPKNCPDDVVIGAIRTYLPTPKADGNVAPIQQIFGFTPFGIAIGK